jgi:hypothetical protein
VPSFQPALRVELAVRGSHYGAADAERRGEDSAGRQSLTGAEAAIAYPRPQLAGDLPGERDILPAVGRQRELDGGTRQVVVSFSHEVDILTSPLTLYGRAS